MLDRLRDASDAGVSAPDDAIKAGVDLFLATSWETSLYAKFLTLVNVLEALKEQPLLGSGVQKLVGQWLQELKLAQEAGEVEPHEAESLRGSLQRLQRRSIASSISSLVLDKLDDPEAAGLASSIYSDRSKLVHDGMVPESLGEHVATLQQLVPKLLRSLLANPTVGDGSG